MYVCNVRVMCMYVCMRKKVVGLVVLAVVILVVGVVAVEVAVVVEVRSRGRTCK